jgi:hypothetical protein
MKNCFCPLLFEESLVTGKTFLAVMEDVVLCHTPAGTVFQLGDVPSYISCHLHTLLDGDFSDICLGRGDPLPWLRHSLDLIHQNFFFKGFQEMLFIKKICGM